MAAIKLGDRIICRTTGVTGTCVKFYRPTASEEQIMIRTDDGRLYHAPKHLWIKHPERKER